jgi:hypothetical protein
MQGSLPWSVDGLRRGTLPGWCFLVSSPGRAPANIRGLSAPLFCCLINTQDRRPAWETLLEPFLPRATCLTNTAPHFCPTHPKRPPSRPLSLSIPNPERQQPRRAPDIYHCLPSRPHVLVSPGTSCRMASFNDYHDYYDSRSRARSRSRPPPPPSQPQYEHYDQYDSVPRSRVREDAYLSPTVPYVKSMLRRTEE